MSVERFSFSVLSKFGFAGCQKGLKFVQGIMDKISYCSPVYVILLHNWSLTNISADIIYQTILALYRRRTCRSISNKNVSITEFVHQRGLTGLFVKCPVQHTACSQFLNNQIKVILIYRVCLFNVKKRSNSSIQTSALVFASQIESWSGLLYWFTVYGL